MKKLLLILSACMALVDLAHGQTGSITISHLPAMSSLTTLQGAIDKGAAQAGNNHAGLGIGHSLERSQDLNLEPFGSRALKDAHAVALHPRSDLIERHKTRI